MFILPSSGEDYNYKKFSADAAFSLFCHAYKITFLGFCSAFSGSPYIRPEALQMTVYSVFTCISPYFKIYTLVVLVLKLNTYIENVK